MKEQRRNNLHHPTAPATLLFALSVFLTFNVSRASSLTFELPYGQRKCYVEQLPPLVTCRGTVHVASGTGEMSLDLFVSDQRGTVYFHKQDVNSVKFSFKTGNFAAHTVQDFRFCVVNQIHPHSRSTPGVLRRITLEVDVVNEDGQKNLPNFLKQEHAEKVYNDFILVTQSLDSVIEKLDQLREQEASLTAINKNTTVTILRLSIVACLFTIGSGFLNFVSLKSFFKRKKIA